jgi:carboxypeptidase Q
VVGELRGRERPDEIVLIGAHLDSWDLAQGAEDDGAGVALVMEAGRLLARLPKAPRRTVRLVLFMNEENGLNGGKAYAAAHEGELARHVAGLEMDSGGGRPTGVTVKAGEGAGKLLEPWLPPLEGLGLSVVKEGSAGGEDLRPLLPFSVPFVSVNQDGTHYFDLHHSAADTLDHIEPKELAQTAAAVAWVTYALAEMPGALPRPPPEEFRSSRTTDTPAAKTH